LIPSDAANWFSAVRLTRANLLPKYTCQQGRKNWLVVSTPLKNISQLGLLFPIYGKMKNVPNHQPENM
jgi:hypothetical protein